MRLFFRYCPNGRVNSYVIGTETAASGETAPSPGEAIIVDPGSMDTELLSFIEGSRYEVRGVLITHDHSHHVRGLRTLRRIYDAKIYGVNPVIRDHQTVLVRDGDTVSIGSFRVEVISVPGHSADSAAFKIGHLLFTGDALSAGLVGRTASSYAAAIQLSALRSRILSLPGDYVILPGHGPPSTLDAERRFNVGLNAPPEQKKHRPAFNFALDE
jgi:glyoxylase-like metal-dependent hydrolase (beta-lactamase superfamily II)